MLAEGSDPRARPPVLAAAVEVLLAAGDVVEARVADDELATFADAVDAPLLHAIADGAARCACSSPSGDAGGAARRAAPSRAPAWRALGMPYEAARARVAIAGACRALGDDDGAELELDAARATFERLGAAPDLRRLAALDGAAHGARPATLTDRELEVLRLVATGRTNREIAEAARHQRAHRRPPPAEHLPQARLVVAGSGNGVRLRARASIG